MFELNTRNGAWQFPRILALSIVNPETECNGAVTVTRGLFESLSLPPFGAKIDCMPVRAEPPRWRRLAQARSLLKACFSTLPSKAVFLESRKFRESVQARIRSERYELIILNGSDLLWISKYLPPEIPRILIAHNIEHLLFESQIQTLGWQYNALKRVLRRDHRRLKAFELNGIHITRNVIFLSFEEAAYAARLSRDLRSTTIPPLFGYAPRRRLRKNADTVLEIGYVGNFGWWPNQLGLRWFIDTVLPYVNSPIRLNLFGHGSISGWAGNPRVVGHGVVRDIEQVWAACDLLICPAFSGAGVCVKFAEAIYNRMPVLANTHAARGLPLGDDPAITVLDESKAWVDFLNSATAANLASLRVREDTAARFSINSYKEALHEFVGDVISTQQVFAN